MNEYLNQEKLLYLLSYSRGGFISENVLKKLFAEQVEEVQHLLYSCGCSSVQTNGTTYLTLPHACRVKLGIKICEIGHDITRVARFLTWKDFEFFVCEIAEEWGYRVLHDVRMKEPRMQIDVVCTKDDFAISFDCKHWRYYSRSALSAAARAQEQRSVRLSRSENFPGVTRFLPAIITVYETSVRVLEGVAIVPVNALSGFLQDAKYEFDNRAPPANDAPVQD